VFLEKHPGCSEAAGVLSQQGMSRRFRPPVPEVSIMSKAWVWFAAAMFGALLTSSADAQWGSIKGQVVLDGKLDPLKLLVKKGDAAAKDAAVCAAQDVPDESVVVDEKTNGIANVIVYLRRKPEKIHPKFDKPAAAKVTYDQMGCKFIPHATILQTNQKLSVVSGDAIAHNTRATPLKNQGFNFIVKANDREGTDVPFKLAENLPIEIRCDIHPWMRGWVMVVDHPYATVTAADGTFEIKDLPPGDNEFRVWQEKVGYLEKSLIVKVADGKETVVPTIKVPAATLK
jgi:hypothetical protein